MPKYNRPDTPLAPTPEPQPVSAGFQTMPVNKYQATADAAIRQIDQIVASKQQPQPQQ